MRTGPALWFTKSPTFCSSGSDALPEYPNTCNPEITTLLEAVRLSVGVALIEGLDVASVMAHADLAMFEARQALPQPGNDGI